MTLLRKEINFQTKNRESFMDCALHPIYCFAKKKSSSLFADCGLSDPCDEFFVMLVAYNPRIESGASLRAVSKLVGPITDRQVAIAFSRSNFNATKSPLHINSTNSPKNPRSLCSA